MLRLSKRFKKAGGFLIILCLIFPGFRAVIHAESPREYQIKAAFLFNFSKFIEWPTEVFPDKETPIVLGIVGKDPFGESLNLLKQKRVKGRDFKIKHLEDIKDTGDCHILFISNSEKNGLEMVFQILKGRNILTVGESENFITAGGIINFIKVQNKIRFEINIEAAKRYNLKISSKLLKLAKVIRKEGN